MRATADARSENLAAGAGPGRIGIEIREIDDACPRDAAKPSMSRRELALACERAFLAALDGSCRTPIAGLATIECGTLAFNGEVLAPDGSDSQTASFVVTLGHNPRAQAEQAGREAGEALKPRVAKWLAL
jgi:hydroxymethylbilane synthase